MAHSGYSGRPGHLQSNRRMNMPEEAWGRQGAGKGDPWHGLGVGEGPRRPCVDLRGPLRACPAPSQGEVTPALPAHGRQPTGLGVKWKLERASSFRKRESIIF